jgi:hypothetical protein
MSSVEKKRTRFIREEPWIAQTLRTVKLLKFVPEELRDWFWDWVQDVEAMARSREMMVSFVVTMLYSIAAAKLLELLGVAEVFKAVRRALGL